MARSLEVSIMYEHLEDDDKSHEVEIPYTIGYEPGESNYGADADGNRGISISGYWGTDDEAPHKCEKCGKGFTNEERAEIEEQMRQKAIEVGDEPPEPDYD
jgi:hypothetical protein